VTKTRALPLALAAAFVFAVPAAAAGPLNARATPPFSFTFRISSATLVATYTLRGAQAATTLHIAAPTPAEQLAWVGKPNGENVRTPRVTFVGESDYTSADPSCASTRPFHSQHPTPVALFTFGNSIHVTVQRFPLATTSDGVDNGDTVASAPRCGASVFDFYDDADVVVPFRDLSRPSFTVTATRHTPDLGSGQAVDWTLTVTVRSLDFHLLKK
jgi:hypothetical protein